MHLNKYYYQLNVTDEQLEYTHNLVKHSIESHTVEDIFKNDESVKGRQYEFRFTGSLGEVVFADAYGLPRKNKSFGANDGQDYGQDFNINGKSIDTKTMTRKNNKFKVNYVLNLHYYQIIKNNSLTDEYFCLNLHKEGDNYIASFVGTIDKNKIINNEIGTLYKKGSKRMKDNNSSIIFDRDTFEIEFKDITSPTITTEIFENKSFKLLKLL
jgi:hypothetical protein